MSEAPQPPEDDRTEIEQGLRDGSEPAEAKARRAQFTDAEQGLGPDTMDQEVSVEAQRDELEQDDPDA